MLTYLESSQHTSAASSDDATLPYTCTESRVSGRSVAVQVDGTGEVTVNEAEIIQLNIQASHGAIHAIETKILPPQLLA